MISMHSSFVHVVVKKGRCVEEQFVSVNKNVACILPKKEDISSVMYLE